MGFFDEDSFDEIVKQFFGETPVRRRHREQFIKGEDEDRTIDFVEEDNDAYFIFELQGYEEEDIKLNIEGKRLEIYAKKKNKENIQDYLHQKLSAGFNIKKTLPAFIESKSFSHTIKNGVLEIKFNKTREKR